MNEFILQVGPYVAVIIPFVWAIFKFVAAKTKNKTDDEIVNFFESNPEVGVLLKKHLGKKK